jgi:hypothetical protein
MNLKLVFAVIAVLAATPVIVAQHCMGSVSGPLAAVVPAEIDGASARASVKMPAPGCLVGVGRAGTQVVRSDTPVRETHLIGAAAAGNLVCPSS